MPIVFESLEWLGLHRGLFDTMREFYCYILLSNKVVLAYLHVDNMKFVNVLDGASGSGKCTLCI